MRPDLNLQRIQRFLARQPEARVARSIRIVGFGVRGGDVDLLAVGRDVEP